jgi:hypothetical protein
MRERERREEEIWDRGEKGEVGRYTKGNTNDKWRDIHRRIQMTSGGVLRCAPPHLVEHEVITVREDGAVRILDHHRVGPGKLGPPLRTPNEAKLPQDAM